jgi:hypothetical protein
VLGSFITLGICDGSLGVAQPLRELLRPVVSLLLRGVPELEGVLSVWPGVGVSVGPLIPPAPGVPGVPPSEGVVVD